MEISAITRHVSTKRIASREPSQALSGRDVRKFNRCHITVEMHPHTIRVVGRTRSTRLEVSGEYCPCFDPANRPERRGSDAAAAWESGSVVKDARLWTAPGISLLNESLRQRTGFKGKVSVPVKQLKLYVLSQP